MTETLQEGDGDDPFFCILCVDGDATLRRTLKRGLENYGFEVIAASPGFDAMMQYKAHQGQFGAIVLGHASHGSEFALSVRKMGYQGRIVVMASRLTVEELRAYEPHGISGFFSKPLDPSSLATMLLQAD